MTTTQQVPQGSAIDFRRSLLGLLWKTELVAAAFCVLAVLLGPAASREWLITPLVSGLASVLVWWFLSRNRTVPAAWALVMLTGLAIFAPLVVAPGEDAGSAFARVLDQGVPFAALLLIGLAGVLLPPWSALLLLAIQAVSTIVLPLVLGGRVKPIHLWAFVLSGVGVGLASLTSRQLFAAVSWSMAVYRDAEQRTGDLRIRLDDLQRALQVGDSLRDRLDQANAALARDMAQLEASAEISRLATTTSDLDQVLDEIVEVLCQRFGVSTALFLTERDGEQLVLRAVRALSIDSPVGREFKLPVDDQSVVGACALHREIRVAAHARGGIGLTGHLLSETRSEIAIPLISRGEMIGVLDMQSPESEVFGERDRAVLGAVADQAASAIANVRSFKETRHALREVSSLQRRYVQEAWDRFTPQLEVAGYRYAEGDLQPLGHRPLPEVSQAVSAGHTVAEADKSLVVPIAFRGQVIGALGLQDPGSGRQWTEEDIHLAESVARQMSVVLDNARLVDETQRTLAEIRELNQRYVREAWEEFLPARAQSDFVFTQPGVPREEPLPAELDDVLASNAPLTFQRQMTGEPGSTFLSPISLRDQVIGVLGLEEKGEAREWTEDELELVDAVGTQMSWSIENARLFEETERRAYELEETARQLRETDLFRAQFLANMSHELRTPLNSIIGFSRVILKGIDGPLTELQETDLEAIYSNGRHLLTMINEILDMSKIEAGKMDLVIENVDLNVLVRGAVSASASLVEGKPIELRTDIREDLPIIRADGTRIRQVITNMMSNAAKFTHEGSITFGVWVDEETVCVSVEDTGEGIPEDKIPLVFEAFRQVDGSSTRRAEGTGLGLPISRQFVEMHGGQIWLESEFGVGSKFTFCIPIEGPTEVVSELVDLEIDETKKLLLVIAQDESGLEVYRQALGDREYQFVGLYDSREAIRWVRYLGPWAVLIQAEQADGAGWEALEAIKSLRATRSYPVIVCSGPDGAGRAIRMGALAHVPEPLAAHALNEVLNRLQR